MNPTDGNTEDGERKGLLELLAALDSFNPVIPDALIDYHFTKAGLQCDDARLKKLVALVAQKFITDVAADALAHQRIRVSSVGKAGGSAGTPGGGGSTSTPKKSVLTLEDLTAALQERGIEVRRPFYHV
jgi:transcription initiation factor TFIID subunit 10